MSAVVADPVAVFDRHRVELTGYCYRMLASPFEAEDAVQETMVRAWRGYDRFEGRVPLRSWLFRIATNVCLTMLDGRRRRAVPMDLGPQTSGDAVAGSALPEEWWLQPIADRRVLATPADPGEAAVGRDSIRLAFVAALQHLPPRQRVVLILRDVLRWEAAEVANLLDTSVAAVKSSLQRARATLAERPGVSNGAGELNDAQHAMLADYVDTFERYDVDRLVTLLHHDATLSMPPHSLWLRGDTEIGRWWRREGTTCRGSTLIAIDANGSPAFAQYRSRPGLPTLDAFAIHVLDLDGGRIRALDCFLDTGLFTSFGLPAQLEASPRT